MQEQGPLGHHAHHPGEDSWGRVFDGTKHVVDTMSVMGAWQASRGEGSVEVAEFACNAPRTAVRFVRLNIKHAATQWGVSLWRMEVYGRQVLACQPALKSMLHGVHDTAPPEALL